MAKSSPKKNKPTTDIIENQDDFVRQQIISVLWKFDEITPENLKNEIGQICSGPLGEKWVKIYKDSLHNLEEKDVIEIHHLKNEKRYRLSTRMKPDIDM